MLRHYAQYWLLQVDWREEGGPTPSTDIKAGFGTYLIQNGLAGAALIFHTGHGTLESLSAEWPDCRLLLKPARRDDLVAAVAAACRASIAEAPG